MMRLDVALFLIGCGLLIARCLTGCLPPNTPDDYGRELSACIDNSKTWEEYTPCCVGVAERYGRDPVFCFEGHPGEP